LNKKSTFFEKNFEGVILKEMNAAQLTSDALKKRVSSHPFKNDLII